MNRKQRRANKSKPHDPVYMVHKSDVLNHVNMALKNDPAVKQLLQEEVQRVSLASFKEQQLDLIALFLLSVRRSEHYGRAKLLRVAKIMLELMKDYEDAYGDCDRYAMRKHLKEEVGIHVENIEKEIEECVKEQSTDKG